MGSHLWRKSVCSSFDMFGMKSFGDIQEQASSKHWVMHVRQSNQLSVVAEAMGLNGINQEDWMVCEKKAADEAIMNSNIYDVDIGKGSW